MAWKIIKVATKVRHPLVVLTKQSG